MFVNKVTWEQEQTHTFSCFEFDPETETFQTQTPENFPAVSATTEEEVGILKVCKHNRRRIDNHLNTS